jgi:hypothetical protein
MSEVKYTKTASFVFPLLEIPKSLFTCDVRSTFGKLMFTQRFINAYLADSQVTKYNDKDYVFLVVRNFRDLDFDTFYSTMIALPNYVDDYDNRDFLIMVYSVPPSQKENFDLIINGKYSELDAAGKKLILSNSFFSGKPMTLPLILNKATALKVSWEERLSLVNEHVYSPAYLYDQEVWPIINQRDEVLSPDKLEFFTTSKSLSISGEF